MEFDNMTKVEVAVLLTRIATKPLSTENTLATWCPPDWEDIVEWWDDAVMEARKLTGKRYREGDKSGEDIARKLWRVRSRETPDPK